MPCGPSEAMEHIWIMWFPQRPQDRYCIKCQADVWTIQVLRAFYNNYCRLNFHALLNLFSFFLCNTRFDQINLWKTEIFGWQYGLKLKIPFHQPTTNYISYRFFLFTLVLFYSLSVFCLFFFVVCVYFQSEFQCSLNLYAPNCVRKALCLLLFALISIYFT